jgi:hypothetical protein
LNLEDPFHVSNLRDGGSLHGPSDQKAPVPLDVNAGLKCSGFGWTSIWKTFATSKAYGGKVTEAYLKAHPGESDEIHVVIG